MVYRVRFGSVDTDHVDLFWLKLEKLAVLERRLHVLGQLLVGHGNCSLLRRVAPHL
jgi:hypothetical protein